MHDPKEKIKYHIYRNTIKNRYIAVEVTHRCECSNSIILMTSINEHMDDKFLRFTSIYDRVYDKYLYINGDIVMYKYIEEGFKYHRFFKLEAKFSDSVLVIPLYDEKIYNSTDLDEYSDIVESEIKERNIIKYRNVTNILNSISRKLEDNDYNEYDLDLIFVNLNNILNLL